MEWSKKKTMKLIEMLQAHGSLWNPALCDTRQDKQKRREEVRHIAEYLEVSLTDATKKIQHLRTQYNREWAREDRFNASAEDPAETYVSNWYAYEYLHFLKASSKPYRIVHSDNSTHTPNTETNNLSNSNNLCNSKVPIQSSMYKISKTDNAIPTVKQEHCKAHDVRDDFSVFGDYVANELRSLKGEKDQLIAKKKILDVIFDVKMSNCEQQTLCTVFSNSPRHMTSNLHNDKFVTVQIDPMAATHSAPSSEMREIIINDGCSYSNFKVDRQ